jgi:hypothetical protein
MCFETSGNAYIMIQCHDAGCSAYGNVSREIFHCHTVVKHASLSCHGHTILSRTDVEECLSGMYDTAVQLALYCSQTICYFVLCTE